jgi:hypothetical protein
MLSMGLEQKIREEMARGYMSNRELENAIHAFGSRCSNISKIYRYMICNTTC